MYRLMNTAMEYGISIDDNQLRKINTMLKRKKEISEMEKAISFVMQEYHLPYCKAREICINRRDEILAQCKMERIKSLKKSLKNIGIETNGINFNILMSRWAEGKVQLSFMFELRYGKE